MLHIFDNQAAITSQVDVSAMMTVDFTAVEMVCNLIDQLVRNSPEFISEVTSSNDHDNRSKHGVLSLSLATTGNISTSSDQLNTRDKEIHTEHTEYNAVNGINTKKPTRIQSTHRKLSLAYAYLLHQFSSIYIEYHL